MGGTVSNLQKDGLILLNTVTGVSNFQDFLNVNYTLKSWFFARPVPDQAQYTVTVYQQPTGQSCNVGENTGTMTHDITNMPVVCS